MGNNDGGLKFSQKNVQRQIFKHFLLKNLFGRQTATYLEASLGSADQFVEIMIHRIVWDRSGRFIFLCKNIYMEASSKIGILHTSIKTLV